MAAQSTTPLLKVEGLKQYFRVNKNFTVKAVDDVSFELFPGEKLAIIGESGSGKTTVVNMITRLLDSTDGKILLDGEDITHYKRNKMNIFFLLISINKNTIFIQIKNVPKVFTTFGTYPPGCLIYQ